MSHPSELIVEELRARGWTRDRLAREMSVAFDEDNEIAHHINRAVLEMYIESGPSHTGMRLGGMAVQLAKAFGTTSELWLNLESDWLKSRESAGDQAVRRGE